ncbi:hypothetical protein pb186bvf_006303 [Paramecium bursaria]
MKKLLKKQLRSPKLIKLHYFQLIKQLLKLLDEYYELCREIIKKNTSVFALTLLNMLKIQESKRILDAGCGGGYLHQYIVNRKTQDSEIFAVDFSPNMVSIAASRMDKFIKHAPNLSNFDETNQVDIQNVQLGIVTIKIIDNPAFKQFNYHLGVASVEDLSQFQSDFFDTYFSNLVFHLIESPKLAFQEAYRVLKNEGRFGITIWGKKENCSCITFQQDSLLELGLLKPEQAYQNFVEDKQIIIDQAKQAGFKNICKIKLQYQCVGHNLPHSIIFPLN